MVHSKTSVIGFALSLSLTPVALPAQAQINFSLPKSVEKGTNVRIDGSSSMVAVNQVLKQQFEQKYQGTQVNLASSGTPEGLQALLDGKIDVAAIGRPLNDAEKAKGLVAVPVGWDKIAIIVGQNNPFARSLSISQFARIFRGEVTNWSQVGGPNAPIKFIDRPDNSDTRQAFRSYPVFKQGKFETGGTAVKLTEDTTAAAVQKLGGDGISYTTLNQLKDQPGAKAVVMHGTPPTDARYPFSQPLYYVYRADQANSPAVKSFLGFATADAGQRAIESADVADAVASQGTAQDTAGADAKKDAAADAKKDDTAPEKDGAMASGGEATSHSVNSAQPGDTQTSAGGGDNRGGLLGFLPSFGTEGGGGATEVGGGPNWWWLFPIGSGAALLWLLGRRGRRQPAAIDTTAGAGFVPPVGDDDSYSRRTYSFDRPNIDGPNFNRPNVDLNAPNADLNAPNVDLNAPNLDAPNLNLPDMNLPSGRVGNVGDAVNNGVQGSLNFAGDTARAGADWVGDTAQRGVDFVGDGVQAGADLAGNTARAGGNLFNNAGAAIAGAGAAAAGAAAWAMSGGKKQPRVVLKARSPREIEAFWDIPTEVRDSLRASGGEKLALRLYDVTDIDLDRQPAHSVQQFECDELTHRQKLPIGLSNRDYLAELGYLTPGGQWLSLGRSSHVRVPPASNMGLTEPPGTVMDRDSETSLHGDRDTTADHGFEDIPPAPTDEETFLERMGRRVGDTAGDITQAGGAAIAGGAAAATGAGAAAWNFLSRNRADSTPDETPTTLSENRPVADGGQYDHGVPADLEGRIVLAPRNANWAYAYWDIPRSQRAMVDRRSDQKLMLRLYDVTDTELLPDRYEQFDVDDSALSYNVPIPSANRSYLVELGYYDSQNHWTQLARSSSVWMPT